MWRKYHFTHHKMNGFETLIRLKEQANMLLHNKAMPGNVN